MKMTDLSDVVEMTPTTQPPWIDILLKRASAAQFDAEIRTAERKRGLLHYVVLKLPNGRQTRPIIVFPADADKFLGLEFENYINVGDYVAVLDKASGRIEAVLAGATSGVTGRAYIGSLLSQLPGIEVITEGDLEMDSDTFEDGGDPRRGSAENWRLTVEQDGVSLEISPASAEFQTLLGRGRETTIKLVGVTTSSHDEALQALERYAAAMLFDLDVVYQIPVQLAKQRLPSRKRNHYERPNSPPKFPRIRYAGQALELYQYGRSAAALPLLEYLAYYQSLEYFFPFFAKEQTVHSVRSQLLHPGFDARNDAELNKLINLAASSARSGMGERDQLRATIRACMTEADVRDFIGSVEEYTDHFCSKKQKIKGVGTFHLSGNQADIRDQAADRIYAIRCRIVHAKQDGGANSQDVLLPSSAETGSLQADVELIRLVAQRALIARAARI